MLCGVIAGYITHSKDEMAYVSFVAVLAHDQGMGIGTQLVRSFISKAEKERKKGVHLYAVQNNEAAMTMYKTLGFQEYKEKEEQRPNDVHLVYWLE